MIGIGLGLTTRRRGEAGPPAFSPASLFGSGVAGAWYDPSDMSTLFQDAAGTIPVTAAGQPVGRMLDKSGNGNHATQATAAKRPPLRTGAQLWWLEFDGSSHSMQTAAIDFTGTNKMSVFAGVRKLSDFTAGEVVEFSPNAGFNNGGFEVRSPAVSGQANYRVSSRGTTFRSATSPNSFAAPHTAVLTMLADIGSPFLTSRINEVLISTSVLSQGTGNYGNWALNIGSRDGTGSFFNGLFYGLVIAGKTVSADEITDTETYLTGKSNSSVDPNNNLLLDMTGKLITDTSGNTIQEA